MRINEGRPRAHVLLPVLRRADTRPCPPPPAPRHTFVVIAIGVSLLLLGAWVAWMLPQPACDPTGSSLLGLSDRWVPWAFIAAEGISLTFAGLALKRPVLTVAVTVVIVGGATVFAGGLITFLILAYAHCFS